MPYPDKGTGCSIEGCARRRYEGMLLCATHWMMVPGPLQRSIYSTWSERKKRAKDGGQPYQFAARAHEGAKKAAIEAVESKERE